MLVTLPTELIGMVVQCCSLQDQATLARTCRRLHDIGTRVLYSNDAKCHGSSAVFYTITRCAAADQSVALGTLEAARLAGANLHQCQEFRRTSLRRAWLAHLVFHPPLFLAARRGLDQIVAFLLDQGVSPDGAEGVDVTPFLGAVTANKESTALLLVKRGACISARRLGIYALHAAVSAGFLELTSYLILVKKLDVSAKSQSGATPMTMAVRKGDVRMISRLLNLGARIYEPLLEACSRQDFRSALKLLDAIPTAGNDVLQLPEFSDLLIFTVTRRSTCWAGGRRAVVDRLLGMITAYPMTSAQSLLDGILQRMLSIDRGNVEMASLLMSHGAKILPGTYVELLTALALPLSHGHSFRLVRRHPKLLQVFAFVHARCVDMSPCNEDMMQQYFLRRAPEEALRLLGELAAQGLSLTARSIKMLAGDSADERDG